MFMFLFQVSFHVRINRSERGPGRSTEQRLGAELALGNDETLSLMALGKALRGSSFSHPSAPPSTPALGGFMVCSHMGLDLSP